MVVVNDIHSRLNTCSVREIAEVTSAADVQATLRAAAHDHVPVCIAGGRHAMGGQQFCDRGVLVDTRGLDRIIDLDAETGLLRVEAGVQWPALLSHLSDQSWSITQKQTGADRLSIGGAVAANIHGRGLTLPPFVSDLEGLTVVDADGELRRCSRSENAELFSLVVGGYGLFGVIVEATLRLTRRRKLERVVEVREVEGLAAAFDERIGAGFLYGDFQFSIDPATDDFLRRGVFSCYRPVDEETPIPQGQKALSREEWTQLLFLAHTDKARAFELYAEHYLATNGQIYLSDAHQFGEYVDGYHAELDAAIAAAHPATEMITEIYVPRSRLAHFMANVATDFRESGVDVVYGTVRLIERDDESFLMWAREPWACVIFNLHTVHTPGGLAHSRGAFCRLIDHAIARGGSYFLTYHRWAAREQVEACYPQFREFLARKLVHDPEERFESDWYRHYRDAFA